MSEITKEIETLLISIQEKLQNGETITEDEAKWLFLHQFSLEERAEDAK